MTDFSEAYVIGLLADVEEQVPALLDQLKEARSRAILVDGELTGLLQRLEEVKSRQKDARSACDKMTMSVNQGNMKIATLHQENAAFTKKRDDIRVEMERVVDEPGLKRKLRRQRAKLRVQIDDREAEILALRERLEGERVQVQQFEEQITADKDTMRRFSQELDGLQGQLPAPDLYTQLFSAAAARAHCRFFLDADVAAWNSELREAIGWMNELHGALKLGKYRLDRNSELLGGRARASVEALYGCICLGDEDGARELFRSVADPGLFFHQILGIFQLWCLGLYLLGEEKSLRSLLQTHRYADGLRGAYVAAFSGLANADERRLNKGIGDILRYEWEGWQDPSRCRGLGVVNLGAVAMARLARKRDLRIAVHGKTFPEALLA